MSNEIYPNSDVAIVGAGPVGLYLALMLGRAGISVVVFESDREIQHRPNPAGHFPMVLDEFKLTGIYDDGLAAGYRNPTLEWHKPTGELLARIVYPHQAFGLQLEQCDLCEIILHHLAKYPSVRVVFGTSFISLSQTESGVLSTYARKDGPSTDALEHRSRYLIGADGGKSTVRKQLNIPLEGFTWPDAVVTFNIVYPSKYIEGTFGGANFTVDPDLWGVIIRLPSDNWRVTFAVPSEEGDPRSWDKERMMARIKHAMEKLIPGPLDEAKITSYAPYSMHQRCATKFVQGKAILAGDAAHLTNPIGALGLTTGMLDAALLGRVLKGVILQGHPESSIQDYAEKRRTVFLGNTSPNATANLERIKGTDIATVQAREKTFTAMNSSDPVLLKQFGGQILGLSSTLGIPE